MKQVLSLYLKSRLRFGLLISIFCLTRFLYAQPPVYLGAGMEVEEKEGKWYFSRANPNSPASDQLPKPGKKGLQIARIEDHSTGQTIDLSEAGKSADDLLKILVGPEGSEFSIAFKKGKKERTYKVQRQMFKDVVTGNDYNFSSYQEQTYIKEHFPYNYAGTTRPSNRDKDSLPDDLDACPDVYGPVAFKGCLKDTDGDGIDDSRDKCIAEFGFAQFGGCLPSDTDEDGVPDADDDCSYKPGLSKGVACPDDSTYEFDEDTDEDAIPDALDPCPDVWGTGYNRGCPGSQKTVADVENFWPQYTSMLMVLGENPENLKGIYSGNVSGYEVYSLKTSMNLTVATEQYLLRDSDENYQQMLVLYRSLDYRQALDYFASLSSNLKNLEYETDSTIFTGSHDELLYEPDNPQEYYEITHEDIVVFDMGEFEATEVNIYRVYIEIYRYREGMKVINEVRLWAELY